MKIDPLQYLVEVMETVITRQSDMMSALGLPLPSNLTNAPQKQLNVCGIKVPIEWEGASSEERMEQNGDKKVTFFLKHHWV